MSEELEEEEISRVGDFTGEIEPRPCEMGGI